MRRVLANVQAVALSILLNSLADERGDTELYLAAGGLALASFFRQWFLHINAMQQWTTASEPHMNRDAV